MWLRKIYIVYMIFSKHTFWDYNSLSFSLAENIRYLWNFFFCFRHIKYVLWQKEGNSSHTAEQDLSFIQPCIHTTCIRRMLFINRYIRFDTRYYVKWYETYNLLFMRQILFTFYNTFRKTLLKYHGWIWLESETLLYSVFNSFEIFGFRWTIVSWAHIKQVVLVLTELFKCHLHKTCYMYWSLIRSKHKDITFDDHYDLSVKVLKAMKHELISISSKLS